MLRAPREESRPGDVVFHRTFHKQRGRVDPSGRQLTLAGPFLIPRLRPPRRPRVSAAGAAVPVPWRLVARGAATMGDHSNEAPRKHDTCYQGAPVQAFRSPSSGSERRQVHSRTNGFSASWFVRRRCRGTLRRYHRPRPRVHGDLKRMPQPYGGIRLLANLRAGDGASGRGGRGGAESDPMGPLPGTRRPVVTRSSQGLNTASMSSGCVDPEMVGPATIAHARRRARGAARRPAGPPLPRTVVRTCRRAKGSRNLAGPGPRR